MGFYQPLFTVAVEHSYFSDGLWKELDFIPVQQTTKLINAVGALVRPVKNGIGVFYDTEREAAMHLCAIDTNGMLPFGFKVRATDRSFANYTALAGQREDAVLYFDNRGKRSDAETGNTELSKGEMVSEDDFRKLAELVADGILDERDLRVPPDFAVRVFAAPPAQGDSVPHYRISFDTRRSFWKYHLLGGMNKGGTFIVDMDNRIEFESCGETVLAGERNARVFRSKERIPVLEASGYRFQLREHGQAGGKVLIKRLPVASESRLGMEVIDGKNEIVLESYVNF